MIWFKQFGSAGDESVKGVLAAPFDHAIAVGNFPDSLALDGTTFQSAGGNDIFLVKYFATNGSKLWAKRYGGSGDEVVQRAVIDSAGDIIIAGYFSGTGNFGNNAVSSAGGRDAFVAKYSGGTGSLMWSSTFGGSNDDMALGVGVDNSEEPGPLGVLPFFSP